MLCPMKKIIYVDDGESGNCQKNREECFMECEKEKCAWWISDIETAIDEKQEGIVFDTGKCAIKLIAEKGV